MPPPATYRALGQDGLNTAIRVIYEAETFPDVLTDWDKEFLEDFKNRVARYAADTHVSPRQWLAVMRIDRNLALKRENETQRS